MSLKRIGFTLIIVIVIIVVYGTKVWQRQNASKAQPATAIRGPAVILFRGDNDPGCQRIYQLVEAAAKQHDKRIQFIQQDWSDANPLLTQYQIRFLPSVIFIDQHGQEKLRIVGESPAVQQQLQQSLAQLEQLLVP
jgi:hypothetical protein